MTNPTIILSAPIRFRVSSSNVTFKDSDGNILDNEVSNKGWLNLTEGSTLEQVFTCDTPDIHLWKVTSPAQEDGSVITFGVAVRDASNQKILAAG